MEWIEKDGQLVAKGPITGPVTRGDLESFERALYERQRKKMKKLTEILVGPLWSSMHKLTDEELVQVTQECDKMTPTNSTWVTFSAKDILQRMARSIQIEREGIQGHAYIGFPPYPIKEEKDETRKDGISVQVTGPDVVQNVEVLGEVSALLKDIFNPLWVDG